MSENYICSSRTSEEKVLFSGKGEVGEAICSGPISPGQARQDDKKKKLYRYPAEEQRDVAPAGR